MRPPRPSRKAAIVLLAGLGLFLATSRVGETGPETDSAQDASALNEVSPPRWSLSLTEQAHQLGYIKFDVARMRWLWWPWLAYLFWGMAYVCDDYFVRTIEVISERFKIPDDVAGATLMALGCNGPEMALNTISIFKPSNIGVGAVIGGEVFNVLVIIGCAMLSTPIAYLPLRISNFSFFRDVIFYVISVLMLYHILKDGQIQRREAIALICGAVVYSTTVATSSKIRRVAYNLYRRIRGMFKPDSMRTSQGTRQSNSFLAGPTPRVTLRKSTTIGEVVNGPRRTNAATLESQAESWSPSTIGDEDAADDSDFENEVDEVLVQAWNKARKCTDPTVGSVIGVRVEVRSRMMDRSNRVDTRYMWLSENHIMVSAAVGPDLPQSQQGRAAGMVYSKENKMWHYGGLVNNPDIKDGQTICEPRGTAESASSVGSKSRLLRTVSRVPDNAGILGLHEVPAEAIPLKDILYVDPVPGKPKMFTVHAHQEAMGSLGRLITLVFDCSESAVVDAWVAALRNLLQQHSNRYAKGNNSDEPPPPHTLGALLKEWAEWFQFPVKFMCKLTIPDMDDPDKQHWYPLAFVMSMAWLAVFAFLVVSACDGLHDDFGISNGILGFTIAAAGTSFPNVFSGMVVSRQGRTTMAVSNALGANVQNVFLALAIPWSIQSCFIEHGPFPMDVVGLKAQIIAIYATLCPVVFIFIFSSFTMPGWSGYVFLLTYVIYLVIALGEQSTGCMTWPVNCN